MPEEQRLREILDRFLASPDRRSRVKHDPVFFPHLFSSPLDIEVAGFIASSLAFGKVSAFMPKIREVLEACHMSPARAAREGWRETRRRLSSFRYRMVSGEDVAALFFALGRILESSGSLEELLVPYLDGPDIFPALTPFVNAFFSQDFSPLFGSPSPPPGLFRLLPDPLKGSAMKRLNLFFRWMVRKDEVDFGIWKRIAPSKLIIPLDTHIARMGQLLGLTSRSTSDMKTAREITRSLRLLDPLDPLKYDFALCHLGISGACPGKPDEKACAICAIREVCLGIPTTSTRAH